MTTKPNTVILNGHEIPFEEGETILTLAQRHGYSIPTLCYEPRLKPAGSCRTCLVAIEGWRRLTPSCATPATPGMVIHTESDRITRHRQTLLALYLTDHPDNHDHCETGAICELHHMAETLQAPQDWPKMVPIRSGRPEDSNPFIAYLAEKCILCERCVRYCDEVEGVSAITLAQRGSHTTISTSDKISLLDSTCEMCGGCIDVCPTGAMTEKMPLQRQDPPERDLEKVRTTCNYCGVGCQMDLNVQPVQSANGTPAHIVKVTSPPPGTTTNDGNLCVKGRFAYDFIHHADRLTAPLIRTSDGTLREATWEEAIRTAATGLRRVKEIHGPQAMAFVSSARCTVEENYLVQKLARSVFFTNNVHQCAAT